MLKLRNVLIVVCLAPAALSVSATAASRFNSSSGSLNGVAVTTSQTAVFAAFLVNQAATEQSSRIDTAISVSNVLAVPEGFQSDFLSPGGGDTVGTVEFYLWNEDGASYFWESGMDPGVGRGLNDDGTLGPGQTYTVLLNDILGRAGFPAGETFVGYGWVVGNFDGIAGTYNVTIFDVGFTQNFELLPGVGQGQSPVCGIPVAVP